MPVGNVTEREPTELPKGSLPGPCSRHLSRSQLNSPRCDHRNCTRNGLRFLVLEPRAEVLRLRRPQDAERSGCDPGGGKTSGASRRQATHRPCAVHRSRRRCIRNRLAGSALSPERSLFVGNQIIRRTYLKPAIGVKTRADSWSVISVETAFPFNSGSLRLPPSCIRRSDLPGAPSSRRWASRARLWRRREAAKIKISIRIRTKNGTGIRTRTRNRTRNRVPEPSEVISRAQDSARPSASSPPRTT